MFRLQNFGNKSYWVGRIENILTSPSRREPCISSCPHLTRVKYHVATNASDHSGEKHAVILLSGGLDSTTVLAMAQHQGFLCHTLSFDYGQRHRCELSAAERIAKSRGVDDHRIAKIDLRIFGGSSLTSDELQVPKNRDEKKMASEIPNTYVPARNTIFLSYALAFAEITKSNDIFIGVNALDYSGYPDCRPEFIDAYQKMARLATKVGVEEKDQSKGLKIHTPIIHMNKIQIIEQGLKLNVDYSQTVSCYDPSPEGKPCLSCDSCNLRGRAFRHLGFSQDPALDRFTKYEQSLKSHE